MAKSDQSSMIRDFLKSNEAKTSFQKARVKTNPFSGPTLPDGQYLAQIKKARFVSRGKPGKEKTFGLELLCVGICDENGNIEVTDEKTQEDHTVTGETLTVFMVLKKSAKSTLEEAIERMCFTLQILGFVTAEMAMSAKELEESNGKCSYTFEDAIAEINHLKFFVRVQLSTSGDFRNVNIREAVSSEGLIELVGDLDEFDVIEPQGEEYEGEEVPEASEEEEEDEGEYEDEGEEEEEGGEEEEEYEEVEDEDAEEEEEYEEEPEEEEEEEEVAPPPKRKKAASKKKKAAKPATKKVAGGTKKKKAPVKKKTTKRRTR